MIFDAYVWALPAAYILDLLFGDPQFSHHPIRYMGKAIEFGEPRFRKLPLPEILSGGFFAVTLILSAGLLAWLLLALAGFISDAAGFLLEILMIYFCISAGSLASAAGKIFAILGSRDLEKAREELAMIVGRDVRNLSETDMSRAVVETVAENLVDGVLSPLFFYLIGGAPLMAAYKMVNTLDSMVGYKNDRYRNFGKVAAHLDDIANFIPARLSVPVIAMASRLLTRRGGEVLSAGFREGRRHASPNAGYPEAAFSGGLHVRLGGPNKYHGRVVDKPWIGGKWKDASVSDIPKACHLMTLSGFIGMMSVWASLRFL